MQRLRKQKRSKRRVRAFLIIFLNLCTALAAFANLRFSDRYQTDSVALLHQTDAFSLVQSPFSLEPYHYNASFSMFSVPVEEWSTESSLRHNLKIFVYDNLPPKFTTHVETCLRHTYVHTVDHVENFKAELGLIYLFRTFPGRVYDPHNADIFVVPYAAEGHCQCHPGYSWNCAQVPGEDMDELRNHLIYLNETTKKRHLFILAGARAKPPLWSRPFKLTTAPSMKPGQIVIPNLEDKAPYQPSALLARGVEWWTARPRKYSFSFIYGGRNAKMNGGGRKYRDFFEADIAANYPSYQLLGQPFFIKRWSSPHEFHKLETFSYYNESIFCPCLPGDLAWQKRFFDALISGCIPVVLKFDTPNLPGGKSWFLPEGESGELASVQQAYPFAKGAFGGKTDIEIDYESFVLEVPIDVKSQDNVSGVVKSMEAILSDPFELRRRQLAMMKSALSFTYGMGKDAHQHDDAFSRILKTVRYYLDYRLSHLMKLTTPDKV